MYQEIIEFEAFVNNFVENVKTHKDMAEICGDMESYVQTLSGIELMACKVVIVAHEYNLKINYINQFKNIFNNIFVLLPYNGQQSSGSIAEQNKNDVRKRLSEHVKQLLSMRISLEFELGFFLKLGFFSENIVAIGSNGAGKTSLSNKLKEHLENNGVVISAQRILLVPDINTINNPQQTASELKQAQSRDKTNKNPYDIKNLQNEFGVVLKNLLADNIALGNKYRIEALKSASESLPISAPPKSNLDRALEIWNSLIEHRTLLCRDGMNLNLEFEFGQPYPAAQMSDGEKVILFLIAQVLQAPANGFVIADEPEMYLHKSVLKKLWDCLEKEREDCIFIYLTHDLDFAASRADAKKIWIKSFLPPSNWEIENIPINSIPESLILELIGSRKNILFCEGIKGSLDEKIYNILFPGLTVTPVGSCFEVISHTRAFNKIETININAIGLIDADHQPPERLGPLAVDGVYSFALSEVENIFFDEKFLNDFSAKIFSEDGVVQAIKSDVLRELSFCKEMQAANYASAKVDYYFKDSNIEKGNDFLNLEKNLSLFNSNVDLAGWYQQRISDIDSILKNNDYDRAISIFNHKGLKKFANHNFKIKDFTEKAIRFMQQSKSNDYLVKKYFPEGLSKNC